MAGGNNNAFRSDPAIERWSTMHATMFQRFRLTPKATRQVLALGVAVPLALYSLTVYTDDKVEWRGKTRQDSLLRYPAPKAEGQDSE